MREERTSNLDNFRKKIQEGVENACLVAEMGKRYPIEQLLMDFISEEESFQNLSKDQQSIVFKEIECQLGLDIKNLPEPSKTYSMPGTSGSPGEGDIKVEMFITDKGGVLLRRYKYSDGDVGYSIGPDYLDDEESIIF